MTFQEYFNPLADAAVAHRLPTRQFLFVDKIELEEILEMVRVLVGRSDFSTAVPLGDGIAHQITYMGFDFFLIETEKSRPPGQQ